jgi:hypothetical protein
MSFALWNLWKRLPERSSRAAVRSGRLLLERLEDRTLLAAGALASVDVLNLPRNVLAPAARVGATPSPNNDSSSGNTNPSGGTNTGGYSSTTSTPTGAPLGLGVSLVSSAPRDNDGNTTVVMVAKSGGGFRSHRQSPHLNSLPAGEMPPGSVSQLTQPISFAQLTQQTQLAQQTQEQVGGHAREDRLFSLDRFADGTSPTVNVEEKLRDVDLYQQTEDSVPRRPLPVPTPVALAGPDKAEELNPPEAQPAVGLVRQPDFQEPDKPEDLAAARQQAMDLVWLEALPGEAEAIRQTRQSATLALGAALGGAPLALPTWPSRDSDGSEEQNLDKVGCLVLVLVAVCALGGRERERDRSGGRGSVRQPPGWTPRGGP